MTTIEFRKTYRLGIVLPRGKEERVLTAIRGVHPLGDSRYDSVHWLIRDVEEGFRALEGATPTAGKIGELHRERSVILMVAIPRDDALLERVLREAVYPNHPWECPSVFIEESLQAFMPKG